jgi:hypothetical protein
MEGKSFLNPWPVVARNGKIPSVLAGSEVLELALTGGFFSVSRRD